MSKQLYRQCDLHRKLSEFSSARQVSYIPAEYAVMGKVLKLKGDDDEWVDGWEVRCVGELTDCPPDGHNSIKFHRRNTGDSLPK